jgi:ABC-type antimicrobial peptide transport system, permease component
MALANTAFAHSIMDNCPEIEDILCVSTEGDCKIEYGDIEFDHINIREATPSIFDFFSYPVIQGNIHDFLTTPNTIVLTESLAEKIFQEVPPIGQTLVISKENFIVNGIIEDLPSNTGLQFSALYFSRASSNNDFLDWGDYFVYCRIPEGVSSGMIQKLDEQTNEKYTEILKEVGDIKVSHHFQSLESIHFDNSLIADMPKGNKKMIYLFSFIAFLILIIASINYINLNIAQLQKRQKELLIRKINGCGKNWILIHILSESAINFLLAAILSSVWALVLLSCINQLFNKQFTEYSIINNLLPLMLLSIAFGFISGIYPAYQVVKSNISRKSHFGNFGKTLVIIQNSISIVMLAGVFLVIKQVQYMKNHDLGLEIAKDKIVAIELPFASENFPGTEVIREKLSQLKEVDKIAFGGNGTNLGNKDSWMRAIIAVKDEDGNDVQFVANQPRIDENYIDLFGIEIIKGRNFNRHLKSDEQWGVIINKTYANAMGWQDPIGKSIFEDTQHNVIGVINDFHFDALYNPIEPLAFFMNNVQPTYLFASIQPKDIGLIQTFLGRDFQNSSF